jgi:hypothetical protein
MTVTSGRKWLGLLQSYNLPTSLARMCVDLLTSRWGSSAAYLTWKASGTKPSHLLFQLAPSMPRTDATEFGLLPTPTTPSGGGERSGDRAGTGDLNYMARKGLWPTPTGQDNPQVRGVGKTIGTKRGTTLGGAVRMWPTPTKQDASNNGGSSQYQRNTRPLNAEVGGSLNPAWVEWLMGFPEGWTDLKPSEMPSSRKSSSKSDGQ